MFVPTPLNLPKPQRRLLRLYSGLDDGRKSTLLAFAEFLAQQQEEDAAMPGVSEPEQAQPPGDIPRPEEETVVAAMRRLTETYPMIERDALLDRATSLMMAHMLQGQPAVEVIDELEALFSQHYQVYLQKFSA
ncbi:conserved hypothetical protein [Thiolapillus brandeum]|uniref:Crp/Fnr family transcriptional regulator n=1 Tax=Thiolapillus brandeum TaxID=1076588 RepID=A0A7U6GKM0_9GAMM|nr:conserved hypothetical protein [Thiolapillus brandeum]